MSDREFFGQNRLERAIEYLLASSFCRVFQLDEFLCFIDVACRDNPPKRGYGDSYLSYPDFVMALTKPMVALILAQQLLYRFRSEFGSDLRNPDWVVGHGPASKHLADFLKSRYWQAGGQLVGLTWQDLRKDKEYVLQAEEIMDRDTPIYASEKAVYMIGAGRDPHARTVLSILKPSGLENLGGARVISLFDMCNMSREGFEVLCAGAKKVEVREDTA